MIFHFDTIIFIVNKFQTPTVYLSLILLKINYLSRSGERATLKGTFTFRINLNFRKKKKKKEEESITS